MLWQVSITHRMHGSGSLEDRIFHSTSSTLPPVVPCSFSDMPLQAGFLERQEAVLVIPDGWAILINRATESKSHSK